MKKTLIYFGLFAFGFNLYSSMTWLISFSKAEPKSAAEVYFTTFLPSWIATGTWYLFSIITTIISIAVFTRYKAIQNHTAFNSLIILQAGFLLLLTWQLL
jgi:hypothetical protein